MTTEGDFQERLDAEPDNHDVRMIFADWLDDRGDPRAGGYRALGMLKLFPLCAFSDKSCFSYTTVKNPVCIIHKDNPYRSYSLPHDWYEAMRLAWPHELDEWDQYGEPRYWNYIRLRQRCEDAVALAFSRLPDWRRVELLKIEVAVATV